MTRDPSYPEGERCLLHAREVTEAKQAVAELKSDVRDLKEDRDRDSGFVRDIRDRLVRVEVTLETLSKVITKQTDRAQEAFFRYVWPIILIVLTAAVTYYLQK